MKSWKIIYGGVILFIAIILAGIITEKGVFRTSVEYYTAFLLFGISLAGLLISVISTNERYSYASAYAGISFMLTAAFAYSIKTNEFSYASVLFYILSLLVTVALYNRFGKLEYLDDFWIILLSAVGFWIILLKFSSLGMIALLLALNTSLLITFLSYALLEEDNGEEFIEEEAERSMHKTRMPVIPIISMLKDLNDILIRTFLMLTGVFFLVLLSKKFFPASVFGNADIKTFLIVLAILATIILYGRIFSRRAGDEGGG